MQFAKLDKFLKDLKEIASLSKEEYLDDQRNVYSLRYLLQVTVETCINIANHIISSYRIGLPKEYADVFRILEKEGIISDDIKSKFIQLSKFRSRLVHVYWEIDDEIIFDYLQKHMDDFYNFRKEIKSYLGTSNQ